MLQCFTLSNNRLARIFKYRWNISTEPR